MIPLRFREIISQNALSETFQTDSLLSVSLLFVLLVTRVNWQTHFIGNTRPPDHGVGGQEVYDCKLGFTQSGMR